MKNIFAERERSFSASVSCRHDVSPVSSGIVVPSKNFGQTVCLVRILPLRLRDVQGLIVFSIVVGCCPNALWDGVALPLQGLKKMVS